jgi:hypothetical protein
MQALSAGRGPANSSFRRPPTSSPTACNARPSRFCGCSIALGGGRTAFRVGARPTCSHLCSTVYRTPRIGVAPAAKSKKHSDCSEVVLQNCALAEAPRLQRAATALARKMAVVLHAMWKSGTPFTFNPALGAATPSNNESTVFVLPSLIKSPARTWARPFA